MAWGVIEHDHGEFLDVVPIVRVDGEGLMDAAHCSGWECECKPHMVTNRHGYKMWIHNDASVDEEGRIN